MVFFFVQDLVWLTTVTTAVDRGPDGSRYRQKRRRAKSGEREIETCSGEGQANKRHFCSKDRPPGTAAEHCLNSVNKTGMLQSRDHYSHCGLGEEDAVISPAVGCPTAGTAEVSVNVRNEDVGFGTLLVQVTV